MSVSIDLILFLQVYGLLGATVGQMCLDPLDLNHVPDDAYFFSISHRSLGLAYNTCMTLGFVMDMAGILFTTYMMLLLNEESERSIRRVIVHLGPISFWQNCTYFGCCLPILAMFFILMMRMSEVEALAVVIAGSVLFFTYQIHFFSMALNALPYSALAWSWAFAPYLIRNEHKVTTKLIVEARFPNLNKRYENRPTIKFYERSFEGVAAEADDNDEDFDENVSMRV